MDYLDEATNFTMPSDIFSHRMLIQKAARVYEIPDSEFLLKIFLLQPWNVLLENGLSVCVYVSARACGF